MNSCLKKLGKTGIVCGFAMMLSALPGYAYGEMAGPPVAVSVCDSGCAGGTPGSCSGCSKYWWCVLHTCSNGTRCSCFF